MKLQIDDLREALMSGIQGIIEGKDLSATQALIAAGWIPPIDLWPDVTETAPGAEERVMVWGGAQIRFGYRDTLGNWRGLHHSHMTSTPTKWVPIPTRKGQDE
ncbi:MAG: hypothetical protein KDJ69_16795 [Nitratireductor sp.]|nr:hypothetical protein [Nitratireductor sp.]